MIHKILFEKVNFARKYINEVAFNNIGCFRYHRIVWKVTQNESYNTNKWLCQHSYRHQTVASFCSKYFLDTIDVLGQSTFVPCRPQIMEYYRPTMQQKCQTFLSGGFRVREIFLPVNNDIFKVTRLRVSTEPLFNSKSTFISRCRPVKLIITSSLITDIAREKTVYV